MTQHELHPCRKPACWIPSLLEKGYDALWPVMGYPERQANMFVWSFYVRWQGKRGSRVNKVRLCEKHHKQIIAMWESEMASDLYEMEVTDQWLVSTNSQMLAFPTPS